MGNMKYEFKRRIMKKQNNIFWEQEEFRSYKTGYSYFQHFADYENQQSLIIKKN